MARRLGVRRGRCACASATRFARYSAACTRASHDNCTVNVERAIRSTDNATVGTNMRVNDGNLNNLYECCSGRARARARNATTPIAVDGGETDTKCVWTKTRKTKKKKMRENVRAPKNVNAVFLRRVSAAYRVTRAPSVRNPVCHSPHSFDGEKIMGGGGDRMRARRVWKSLDECLLCAVKPDGGFQLSKPNRRRRNDDAWHFFRGKKTKSLPPLHQENTSFTDLL